MHSPLLRFGAAVTFFAAVSLATAIDAFEQAAYAQTTGMTRRQDRRDTRQQSRDVKHECNASGQASRAQCRHAKHTTKQVGRQTNP